MLGVVAESKTFQGPGNDIVAPNDVNTTNNLSFVVIVQIENFPALGIGSWQQMKILFIIVVLHLLMI